VNSSIQALDSAASTSRCPLCDSTRSRHVTTEEGYDIVECASCSLLHVSPMPDGEVGKAERGDRTDDNLARLKADKEKVGEHCFAELAREHPSRGYLVDIGCGYGVFLDQARRAGWTALGLDLSPSAWRLSQADSGCSVLCASVDHIPLADGSVTAVTMWNVLEHLHDPKRSLAEVARVLQSERGVLIARVPNMNFHWCLRRLRFVAEPSLRLLGKRMPPFLGGIAPPEHLLGFTPKTLRLLLEQAGYQHVQIRPGRSRADSWGTGDLSLRTKALRALSRALSSVTDMLHVASRGSVAVTPTLEAWGTAPSELRV
jgi:SAM-dependent methyltransferase